MLIKHSELRNDSMKKVVMFGAGNIGRGYFHNPNRKYEIVAVLDNNKDLVGKTFENEIPIISLNEYLETYRAYDIVIAVFEPQKIEKQLKEAGIYNYCITPEIYILEDVPTDSEISHGNWSSYLEKMFNKEGMEILEVGARNVTGDVLRNRFSKANYTGFDYYPGENVDVVGDAHELSSYFNKKFDLIFCSAVFEHLAMPWKVSLEMVKLLKTNGYVFIETHYSYSSHERPWHFFQFSENALDALFPEKFGMQCIKKGCSNLIVGRFSEYASEYLVGQRVRGLYCHSEYLGQKVKEVDELSWDHMRLEDVVKSTEYPKPQQE